MREHAARPGRHHPGSAWTGMASQATRRGLIPSRRRERSARSKPC